MHCGLGEHEKSFTSISLSKVHLENRQVQLKPIHQSNASPITSIFFLANQVLISEIA